MPCSKIGIQSAHKAKHLFLSSFFFSSLITFPPLPASNVSIENSLNHTALPIKQYQFCTLTGGFVTVFCYIQPYIPIPIETKDSWWSTQHILDCHIGLLAELWFHAVSWHKVDWRKSTWSDSSLEECVASIEDVVCQEGEEASSPTADDVRASPEGCQDLEIPPRVTVERASYCMRSCCCWHPTILGQDWCLHCRASKRPWVSVFTLSIDNIP